MAIAKTIARKTAERRVGNRTRRADAGWAKGITDFLVTGKIVQGSVKSVDVLEAVKAELLSANFNKN